MAFVLLIAFIFVLGLSGRKATRDTYILIALAAVVASAWEYFA